VKDAITGGTAATVTGTLSTCTSVPPFAPGHCSTTLNGLFKGLVVTEPPAFVPMDLLMNSASDEMSVQAAAVAGSLLVTHLSVVVPPAVTVEGVAVKDAIAGGGALTVTDVVAALTIPVHCSVAV
jgi:hypothetical protein